MLGILVAAVGAVLIASTQVFNEQLRLVVGLLWSPRLVASAVGLVRVRIADERFRLGWAAARLAVVPRTPMDQGRIRTRRCFVLQGNRG
jgi:hypothetical protein